MSHELLTLLSGRTLPIEVYPLSLEEIVRAKTTIKKLDRLNVSKHRHEIRYLIDEYLKYGGFPDVALHVDKEIAYAVLDTYAKTILFQDVASRLSLKKPMDLEKLFYYLTSHLGVPFFYAKLGKLFGISDKTVKEYIQALIDANLLFEIDRFSFSLKQQIRTAKKIYSIDPGLANAIAFKFSENHGRLLENMLYLQLKRDGKEIYYYKTAQDYEVDFLVKNKSALSLIQVCSDLSQSDSFERETRALVHAAKELKLKEGVIVTMDDEGDHTLDGVGIKVVPFYKYLLL
jgi:predicted AAA+ superfamily ATPase